MSTVAGGGWISSALIPCYSQQSLREKRMFIRNPNLHNKEAFIDKFRYNAKRASLVQSRIKALERLGHVDAVVNDPDYKFEFPTPDDRPGAPIISFRKCVILK
ncbi:hypothetical protein EJ110_NYTH53615 [Nymphaea thermarum]|nr:hypothetical protein EJ110_NYTH53615 [Nymphaea thermarum]